VLRFILTWFFVSRIILTAIGMISYAIIRPEHYVWHESDFLFLDIWGVWDSGWYIEISNNWYPAVANEFHEQYSFFPLYPGLMKLLGFVTGNNFAAGIIISNACLIITAVYLFRLVRMTAGEQTAFRAVKFLFLFPVAFILSGVFTESLYLMLIVMSFYYAKKQNWMLAGIFGFFLSLTRAVGICIIIPLVYEYIRSKNFSIKKMKADVLFLAFIPAGLAVFCLHLHYLTGDFLKFAHNTSGWEGQAGNIITHVFSNLFSLHPQTMFLAWYSLLVIIFPVVFFRKTETSQWMIILYSVLIPLSFGLMSMPRMSLAVFPFFILLAKITENKTSNRVLTVILAAAQAVLSVFWFNGFDLII